MKSLTTTASEYPYPFVVGQKVRYRPLLSRKMVEAYIARLPDDDNAIIRNRQGKELRIKLSRLYADASLYPGQKYVPLTMPWSKWLLQRIPLRKIDPFLCEAIWTYVNDQVFHKKMVRPKILVERLPGFDKGRFYAQEDTPAHGYIVIDPAGRLGLNGLASVVCHEAIHQWQAYRNVPLDHGSFFSSIIPRVLSTTGIKVFLRADSESDEEFELGLHTIESDEYYFYLFARVDGEWRGGATSDPKLASDVYEAYEQNKRLELLLYKAKDMSLMKLLCNFSDQIKYSGSKVEMLHAPDMLVDYARRHFTLVNQRPPLILVSKMKKLTLVTSSSRHVELALTKQEVLDARNIYLPFMRVLMTFAVDHKDKLPPELLKFLSSSAVADSVKFLRRYKFDAEAIKLYQQMVRTYIKTKGNFDAAEQEIEDFAVAMRERMGTIKSDQAISPEVIKLMDDWQKHFRTGSESAYNSLQSKVSVLNDPWLSSQFTTQKVAKSSGARSKVSLLVKKLTGKPGIDLSKEERVKLARSKPAVYKEFLQARLELIKLGKSRLAQQVRSSGSPLMDSKKAKELLEKEGFISTVPAGFVGKVDETGALYTSAGKKILGGSGGATSVTMNPKYDAAQDNAYVFSFISPVTGKPGRVYTEEFRNTKNHHKFEKTADFVNQIVQLRNKWGAALLKDGSKQQPLALILEIAYQTQARIGNIGNSTEGKNTYGLTTLEVRHANQMSQTKIRLLYPGKAAFKGGKDGGAAQRQKHYLIGEDKFSKKAVELLRASIRNGAPNDPLVSWRDRRVTSQSVNMYLKSLGTAVTVKTMRTMKGTLMARDLLAKSPFAKAPGAATERKVTDWLKKALTNVGAQLGHMSGEKVTPNTAIRHYIDPSTIQSFYDAAGVRPPPAIEKILNHNRSLT